MIPTDEHTTLDNSAIGHRPDGACCFPIIFFVKLFQGSFDDEPAFLEVAEVNGIVQFQDTLFVKDLCVIHPPSVETTLFGTDDTLGTHSLSLWEYDR